MAKPQDPKVATPASTLASVFQAGKRRESEGQEDKAVDIIPFERAFQEVPGCDFHIHLTEKVGV